MALHAEGPYRRSPFEAVLEMQFAAVDVPTGTRRSELVEKQHDLVVRARPAEEEEEHRAAAVTKAAHDEEEDRERAVGSCVGVTRSCESVEHSGCGA